MICTIKLREPVPRSSQKNLVLPPPSIITIINPVLLPSRWPAHLSLRIATRRVQVTSGSTQPRLFMDRLVLA